MFTLIVFGTILLSFVLTKFFLFVAGGNAPPPRETGIFIYSFNVPGTLDEARRATKSPSPYWFLDSGGKLLIENGVGETVQGALPASDTWRIEYAHSNSLDTDNGYHPQNLFRLITKNTWENFSEQARFYIVRDNFSASPNRNASNGLLLMSRYGDNGATLYYAGIRVDGTAIIKKKYHGVYYTMAQEKIFPGAYSAGGRTNLLPHGEWLGLQLTTVTNPGGTVTLSLALTRDGQESWMELLSATDTGANWGNTPPITGPAFAGIRTDFMDVKFGSYQAQTIGSR